MVNSKTRTANILRYNVVRCLCLLWLLPGCGGAGDEVERVAVSGTVSANAEPVSAGTLNFVPVGKGPACGTAIQDGRFEIPANRGPSTGEYDVRLTLQAGKVLPAPGKSDEMAESATKFAALRVTVSADGKELDLKF